MSNFWAMMAPMAMMSVGMWLQARDTNKTGADDSVGTICVALAPAVTAALDSTNSEKATIKAMRAVRDAAQAYLESVGQV